MLNSRVVLLFFVCTLTYAASLTLRANTNAPHNDQDWANLARYRDSDAELAKLPAGTNEVIFMGASVIDFWTTNGDFFPGKPYVNRGISGQITAQNLVRFRPDAINLKPKVILILCGSNDIATNLTLESMGNNIMSMTELALANKIKVVLSGLTPVCGAIVADRPPEKVMAYNAWLKSYAAQAGVVFVDMYSPLIGPDGLFRQDLTIDCLHPNKAGYAIMSTYALDAIKKAEGIQN